MHKKGKKCIKSLWMRINWYSPKYSLLMSAGAEKGLQSEKLRILLSWSEKITFLRYAKRSRFRTKPEISRCKHIAKNDYFSQPSNQMEISSNGGKNVLFIVRLCSDVVLEVLCWGDRRQLALLEKFGKRFYLLIDGSFKGAPFLRLDLHIDPLK